MGSVPILIINNLPHSPFSLQLFSPSQKLETAEGKPFKNLAEISIYLETTSVADISG